MSPSSPDRCSAQARQLREPLGGTAPYARRWLLIEHDAPWSKHAVETPPIAGRIADCLTEAVSAHEARMVLIRRHGHEAADESMRSWFTVDTQAGISVQGTWRHADDLRAAAASLGGQLDQEGEPADPMLLVCTHANRDSCCAIRGRPVAAALAKKFPDEVWECSHIGGHRFAGNLLSLPDGACYGNLDLADAVRVVEAHRAGRVDAAHLRGLVRWRQPLQAALAYALGEYGPAPVDAVTVSDVHQEPGGDLRVHLRGQEPVPDSVWVRVTKEEQPPALRSCNATPKAWLTHRVQPARPPSGRPG